jgi:tripartite-type tricarboxylate transporter receptor subunit TctC
LLKSGEATGRLESDGLLPGGGTPEQFLATIRREIELWRKVVDEVGIKVE